MSGPLGVSQWMYATDAGFYGYTIDQSLRFNDGDSPRLSLDPIGTPTLATKCTISFWFKRSALGAAQYLFCGEQSSTYYDFLYLNSFDNLDIVGQEGASSYGYRTSAVFRDVGAWYHLVLECDSTLSTGTDRYKLYINGVQQTLGTSIYGVHPQNHTWYWNTSGNSQSLGRSENYGLSFDGYMAEVNFIDGTALDATSFGETSNGVWVPKAYSGTYGNNGFYLPFDDSSAIGDDESGNTNDFTANNLAATDILIDTPSNNFACLNALYHSSSEAVLSEGNLKADTAGLVNAANGYGAVSTFAIPKDKKIYIEVECTDGVGSNWFAGFASQSGLESGPSSTNVGGSNAITVYNRSVYVNGSETDYGSSAGLGGTGAANLAAGDILGCMCDGATGKVWFSRNGTYFKTPTTDDSGTTGDPAGGNHEIGTITNGTTEDVFFVLGGNTSVSSIFVNFGQDTVNVASANADANGLGTFEYAPPTDYVCLASSSLTEPTIGPNSATQSDDHFDILLWTGNGSNAGDSQEINGLSFTPDLVWTKGRGGDGSNPASGQQYHEWHDSVRGAGKRVFSNDTAAESDVQTLTSFDNDGFTVAMGTGGQSGTNQNTTTMVGWSWKAGGAAVSNTDGSITSSVSANQDAGMSICTWTGNGTSGATIGHGLSSAPELIFSKRRDSSGLWATYAKPAASDAETDYLRLDTTDAPADDDRIWNDTAPTASVFSVGSGTSHINTSSATHVTYCFHSVEGYSKVGSYEGNSSADGTFVYLGFRPAWIMLKKIDSTAYNWNIHDTSRDTTNPDETSLFADSNVAENGVGSAGDWRVDMLSNGFKLRENTNYINQSSKTVIYLAFAEAPFKYANAR